MKLFWSYIVAHVSTQCFPLYIRLNLLLKVLVFVLRLIDLCFSFDTIQIINSRALMVLRVANNSQCQTQEIIALPYSKREV